ncbi:MAG: Ig-like domain-containing protein [Longimicrobiales bacterium]
MHHRSTYHRIRSTAAAVAVCLTVGAVVSCDSSDPSSLPEMSDVRILVDSASLDVAEGQTVDLKATVVDSEGLPVEGARIEWSSANTDIAEVTRDGRLTAKQAGKVELTASALGNVWDFWAWIRSLPKTIAIAAGDDQEGAAGETLPTPLTVRVLDRSGEPSEGVPVTFSVTSGEGSISPASGVTDSVGRVSAEWTLGQPGEQGVEARVHPEYAKVMSRSAVSFTAIAQGPDTEDPPVSVGKVTIAVPADTVLEIDATATLTAVARDADGILIEDATIEWSSSNPEIMTVDEMGRLVARAAGTVLITAAAAGCTSDTQRMVVDPPVESESPAAVTDLEVVDVTTDAITLRWTSVPDGNGGVANYVVRAGSPTLNWQSAGSTQRNVGADGVGEEVIFTYNGLQPGTDYEIGVDSYRGSLDANPVYAGRPDEVSSRTDESGGTSGQLVGECSNAPDAWIWCDDFEQHRLDSYFEYDDADGSFEYADGVGVSGSPGMRVRFSAGQVDAGSLKLAFGRTPSSYFDPVDAGVTNHRDLFWRMYVRNAPGWTGGGGEKLSRATSFAGANWQQAMIAHVWSGGSNDNHLVIDPASGTDAAGNLRTTSYNDFGNLRWLGARMGQTPVFDGSHVGSWYCIEAHVRLNDAGQSNGVFEYWIDGDLEARTTDLNWVGAYDEYGVNAVFIENHWNDGAPRAQERYIDNFVVSTARIGCGSGSSAPPPGEEPPASSPARIEVNPSSVTLNGPGDTRELTATAYDADGQALSNVDLEWSSSNTGIVEVDATGRILARAAGVATITAAAVCCDLDAVSQVRVDEESPAGAEPAIVENFRGYDSFAEFLADPRYAREDFETGRMAIDSTVGHNGSYSLRYDWPARPGQTEFTISRSLDIENRKEVWFEGWFRVSDNWTLDGGVSNYARAYKWLHVNVRGAVGRYGTGFTSHLVVHGPDDAFDSSFRADHSFDMNSLKGRFVRVRFYTSLDPDEYRLEIDGKDMFGLVRGFNTAATVLTNISLGRNMNQGPNVAVRSWWSDIKIYYDDPGWW